MSSKALNDKTQESAHFETEDTWEEIHSQIATPTSSQNDLFPSPSNSSRVLINASLPALKHSSPPESYHESNKGDNDSETGSSSSQSQQSSQKRSETLTNVATISLEKPEKNNKDIAAKKEKQPNKNNGFALFSSHLLSLKWFHSRGFNRLLIISITTVLLPFVSGAMMGLGEIFAHQLMFNWGWRGARPTIVPSSNTFFPQN